MQLNKDDYILSFSAHGVSVFVTDIHVDVYKDLEVLFLIDEGMFKQYFTKTACDKAFDRGLTFYSDIHAFDEYQNALESHCSSFKDFFTSEIKDKESLSKETLKTFFEYTEKLCKDYTLMNFEHTDKAFLQQDTNPVIGENLAKAAQYKDVVRNYMNEVLFEPDGYASQVFNILARQFDTRESILENLMQKELLNLYENKKPDLELVSQRQKAFVIDFDRSHIYEGQAALEVLQEFRDDVIENDFVVGKTASLGKVTGPVKIINVDYTDLSLLHREIERMNQGDVLIAETTAPELIIACKKAAAIVTDIGGQLSHAAIVSREFGIPCVVGTENATRVFKDGDIVEVDAAVKNGIVRKVGLSSLN